MKWVKTGSLTWSCFFLYECWAGHRLLPEKTVPWKKRAERIVEVPTAPVSEEVHIRLGCQFIGSLFRGLDTLEETDLSLVVLDVISVGSGISVGCIEAMG